MNEEQGATRGMASLDPIVVDLGKTQRKKIRDLKRGRGKLMGKVVSVIEEIRAELGAEADDKVLMPVLILFRRKSKKRRRNAGLFGL